MPAIQSIIPTPISSSVLGTTADAFNTDWTLNTSAATISANEKGELFLATQDAKTFSSFASVSMTTNTTLNAIVSGAGATAVAVTINTKGAAANTLKLYDAATVTGTPFATIDTTDRTGTFLYNKTLGVALTAIMATGTAADVTITYRGP